MDKLFQEFKRRKVFKVGAMYAVVAWLLMQVAAVALPTFEAPLWINRTLIFLLVIGFPIALVLAWAYEITPDGIRLDSGGRQPSADIQATSIDRKLIYATFVLVLIVAIFQIVDRFVLRTVDQNTAGKISTPISSSQVVRSSLNLGELEPIPRVPIPVNIAISPDGSQLAYTARVNGKTRLYLRSLNRLEPKVLLEVENLQRTPFDLVFSPDGQQIMYIESGPAGNIRSISTQSGATRLIASGAVPSFGVAWMSNTEIVFPASFDDGTLYKKSITGNDAVPLNIPKQRVERLNWPQLLPGGDWLLYTVSEQNTRSFNTGRIEVFSLRTGKTKTLIEGGYRARYSSSGHIVFMRGQDLWAVTFDSVNVAVVGIPTPVISGIKSYSNFYGFAVLDFSSSGRLLYLPGTDFATTSDLSYKTVLKYRGSGELPADLPFVSMISRFSPDNKQLAMSLTAPNASSEDGQDIWIYDLDSAQLHRRTFIGTGVLPIWTPQGDKIVYLSQENQNRSSWIINADGSGQPQLIVDFSNTVRGLPYDISPDGKNLIYVAGQIGNFDIYEMSFDPENRRIRELIVTPDNERYPHVSPDGRLIAYYSYQTGQAEVYVKPYPNTDDGRWQVSNGGGMEPLWTKGGKELVYIDTTNNSLVAVPITVGDGVEVGEPEVLVSALRLSGTVASYTISPDGEKIVYLSPATEQSAEKPEFTSLIMVDNWFEELKQLAPVGAE